MPDDVLTAGLQHAATPGGPASLSVSTSPASADGRGPDSSAGGPRDSSPATPDRARPLPVAGTGGDPAAEAAAAGRRADDDVAGHGLPLADVPEEVAEAHLALAVRAAEATPVSELEGRVADVSRVRPLLAEVLDAVARLFETDRAVLWLLDPGSGQLLPEVSLGFAEGALDDVRPALGQGPCGLAVEERRTVVVADVRADPGLAHCLPLAEEQGWRAVVSTPLLTLGGDVMGSLAAYFREPGEPSAEARSLVVTYARQAAEVVERARMHAEARELARLERRRAEQLRGLAGAALALSRAEDLRTLLRVTTEAARDLVGAHQGVTSRIRTSWADADSFVSLSDAYAEFRDYRQVPKGLGIVEPVLSRNAVLRLTGEQLQAHPSFRHLQDAPGHPPLPDYLAAPLLGRVGQNLGMIQLSHKYDGSAFTEEDEAILVQLGQMASSTVERLEALQGERSARQHAERVARTAAMLSAASVRFSGVLEPADLGEALVDVAVQALSQVAVLHVVDETGDIRRVAHRAADGALARVAGDLPLELVRAVVTAGQPSLAELTAVGLPVGAAGAALRCVAVPLQARGRVLGALSLVRPDAFDDADVAAATDLASRAALALDTALRYVFERDVAATLQRSLLPRGMPTAVMLSAASRYLPAARGTQIGGDWFDLIELPDGALLLVVGDVMGHGISAAAEMGQLRAAVRAYALDGHSPAEVLARLDRLVQALDELHFTTCVIGRLDPSDGLLRVAAAGHLPPLVVGADGGGQFLDLEPGLPLGVGGAEFVEHVVELAPGETVLLYTDGLVEGRHCPVDEGMRRLQAAVAAPVESAEEVCDRVLAALGRDGDHDDDTAVLALVRDASDEAGAPVDVALPATPVSAASARALLAEVVGDRGDDGDVAALLVTELVANAARHAGGDLRLRAGRRGDLLRVEVWDGSERLPVRAATPDWEHESGRGVVLVDALSDRWGADPLPSGKRVWFEVLLGG